jgi:hypothetical protein
MVVLDRVNEGELEIFYNERHKYVDIPWTVIASEAKQSQGLLRRYHSSQ